MEAIRGGKLDAGQHEHSVQQTAVLRKNLRFFGRQAVEFFEQRQVFDLAAHRRDTAHRVVVGERDHIQTACGGGLQDLQVCRVQVLIISGKRRMNMQIHAHGLQLRFFPPLVSVTASAPASS